MVIASADKKTIEIDYPTNTSGKGTNLNLGIIWKYMK